MPALVLRGTLALWRENDSPGEALREREEHAYRWTPAAERGSWIGAPRAQAPAEAQVATGGGARLAHDLRHALTRAELELEAGETALARAALAEARALCTVALDGGAQPLDLVALCSAEARAAARQHEGREIQSSLPRACAVACAQVPLRRLLANLLGNALRASPAGEAVCFALASLPDGGAQLSIQDRGPGFAPEAIDGLLSSRASASGGSGIGSLSVMECARELRASIEVRSGPGSGSEFVVRLPG